MNKYIFILFLIALSFVNQSQNFYVTSRTNVPLGNKTFNLNVTNCDSLKLYTCPPTNNTSQYSENVYADIAIDNNQNIYYVSGWGSLYKRSLADTTTCQFIGGFGNTINALVTDSNGVIYAAGNQNNVCTLYKYDSGSFSTVGNFPNGFFSSGDLFFYEHRLFLTASNASQSSSFLVEISLPNPQQSCYYMDLISLQPFAAFSIRNGLNSKAYIISSNNYPSSSLYEVNIPGQSISSAICTYPFEIEGAAAYYSLSTNSVTCLSNPTAINQMGSQSFFIKAQNPASGLLNIYTNIQSEDIETMSLVDISGRLVRTYSKKDFPDAINITGIDNGLYYFELIDHKKKAYIQKIIIH